MSTRLEKEVRWESVEIISARTHGTVVQLSGPGDGKPREDPIDFYVVDQPE